MANIKDFAVGIVVTGPSPATSGTTATLRTGDAANLPTPPFYATATPPGQLSTIGTSEKILVTAVNTATDVITFTRAQAPTSAQSITANWIIANAIYTSDIFSSSMVMDEKMVGTIDNTNKVFTTASPFSAILVTKNGVNMHVGDDYTITGPNQITFVTAPASGKVTATYIMGSSVMINGSNSQVFDETPSGTIDGTNKVHTTLRPYIAGTLAVYVNGNKQKRGVHFFETSPSAGTFTMSDAMFVGDDAMVDYQFVQSVSGNADTVDGIHASSTPVANQLMPLDSNAKIPASLFTNPYKFSVALTGSQTSGAGSWVQINLNSTVFDTSSNFSTTNHQFTAPVAGFYHFDFGVNVNAGVALTIAGALSKNGAANRIWQGTEVASAASGYTQVAGSALAQLSANDTIQLNVYTSAASPVTPGDGATFLHGFLVSVT